MEQAELSRELLSDRIYDLIRASILDGTRAPGSRLVESELARRLNVSQAPVREAVKRLIHSGLAISEPRRGTYVTEISQDEFAIARELRASLERVGARVAVETVTDDDLNHLREIVRQMEGAISAGDSANFRTLDMEFHGSVLKIGQHPILERLWDTLEPVLVSQRAIGDPSFRGDRHRLVGWHLDLIAALESRDADAAETAFYLHAAGALDPGTAG